jgi:uroporphyrinogen-III synthase
VIRVLITRAEDRARTLANLLIASGMEPVVVPVTQIVFCTGDLPVPNVASLQWIFFTSANAVEAFHEFLRIQNVNLSDHVKIACVGVTTAEKAQSFFHRADYIPNKTDANSLAAEFIQRFSADDQRILWPCALEPHFDLPLILRHAGADLIPFPCYKTTAIPPAELRSHLQSIWPWNVAVFAAPSAVKSFAQSWPNPWSFAAVAIGSSTMKALQPYQCARAIASVKPEPEAVLAAILSAVNPNG